MRSHARPGGAAGDRVDLIESIIDQALACVTSVTIEVEVGRMGYAVLNREQLALVCSVWGIVGARWSRRRQVTVDR